MCAGPKHVVENIPDYPDFAQDVYRVICDYFSCLVEPLFTFALYDDITSAVGMFIQCSMMCPSYCLRWDRMLLLLF